MDSLGPQVPLIAAPRVGPEPVILRCPSCRASIYTKIRHEPNNRSHIIALIFCLFLCLPCVFLPYCMDSCQSANHYCPTCGAFIGSYKP